MLKSLMLGKRIEQKKEDLAALLEEEKGLEVRAEEVEAAIDEAKTEEEIATVEEQATEVEKDQTELEEKKTKLEEEIAALEKELQELKAKEPNSPAKSPERKENGGEVRVRTKFFRDITRSEVDALIAQEDVKEFLTRVRGAIAAKRAVTGEELTVPIVFLDILRDNLHKYSKLITKVNHKSVGGTARQNIVGAVPEAIWTEMVGTLNELNLVFNQVEVDGYKVGGYIPIPNSVIEDSDLNLADEVLSAIAQGIGLALDKAVLYGTGAKMPVGIVTRLAEVAQPAYWGIHERAWANLSASNLLIVDQAAATPEDFFADIILKLGAAQANYSNGNMWWAMSTRTYRVLQAKALRFNAAGAIVAGVQNTMPIIGGEVVLLDFIPNHHVIGGYGSLYLLAERGDVKLAQSEHVQFIQDNTVFKGTARYDGRPVFGEAFVGMSVEIGVGAAAPAPGDVTFAADTAN